MPTRLATASNPNALPLFAGLLSEQRHRWTNAQYRGHCAGHWPRRRQQGWTTIELPHAVRRITRWCMSPGYDAYGLLPVAVTGDWERHTAYPAKRSAKRGHGARMAAPIPGATQWDATRCNSFKGSLDRTISVHAYPRGASPYGLLDMAGNAWKWTRSLWGRHGKKPDYRYPYRPTDGREDLALGERYAGCCGAGRSP